MRVFRMRGTINKCWGLIIWGAGYTDGWALSFYRTGGFLLVFIVFSSSRLVFSLFLFLVSVWIEHRRSACLSGGTIVVERGNLVASLKTQCQKRKQTIAIKYASSTGRGGEGRRFVFSHNNHQTTRRDQWTTRRARLASAFNVQRDRFFLCAWCAHGDRARATYGKRWYLL